MAADVSSIATTGAFFALSVSDIDASARWYAEKLGLRVTMREPTTNKAAIVDDFDRTIATLRSRGVEIAFGPFPKRENQRANAIIKDNAGNFIQIFGK